MAHSSGSAILSVEAMAWPIGAASSLPAGTLRVHFTAASVENPSRWSSRHSARVELCVVYDPQDALIAVVDEQQVCVELFDANLHEFLVSIERNVGRCFRTCPGSR